ncbi:hypothetical protein N7495_000312 [Penicillium taxi]|uniref:uncharacterized protein n=1 Tax=Penicillium taxi TaxID=168475 RepID=UPI002544F4C6|nr:uncharacterized protein N7495_000312 [Penicillium taxi]KAJ5907630.1 hypothetical protein N7495_000312 [Penicillium taxi]
MSPHFSKRRRVFEEPTKDEDGDIEMENGGDIYSITSSPEAQPDSEDQDHSGPKEKPSRRRIAKGINTLDQDDTNEARRAEAQVAKKRSSVRQRKAPKRFEDEVLTPMLSRRAAATPRNTRATRTVKTPQGDSIEGDMEIDDQSPQPTASIARTRSKRSTVKPRSSNVRTKEKAQDQSPSPEDDDGLDELVDLQLQETLQKYQTGVQEDALITEPLPEYVETLQNICNGGLQNEMRTLSNIVLQKLSGKRQIPLKGLENEYKKVNHLIEQTVTLGEGNSMLLLGSRGSGKTAMVETIISSISKQHGSEFHVVRLNGFLHTDDRLALREMWRQLGRETHTEDDAAKVSSYADTMATLLALLSHPEELFGASGSKDSVAAKSIVILLDEFDLFVTHPRQTLLYNLFDIAQSRKAPIAVIGLTTKVDVTEMLEKRVKSRFSHRYEFVPLPRTFEIFSDICMASLGLEDGEALEIAESIGYETTILQTNGWKTLLQGWNLYLKHLWNDKDFQYYLRKIFNQTKSVKEFLTSALIPVGELYLSSQESDTAAFQIPTPKSFVTQTLACPDPAPLPFSTSSGSSSSPSSLPLALLLAATRLAALFDPGHDGVQSQSLSPLALSFPAAYAEYVRLLTSAKTSASVSGAAATPGRIWGRDVARESWEKLVIWGLVTPVGSGNGTADGQMFRVEMSFEEVVEMAGSSTSLGQWWRDS